jgi:hypothetical protein
MQRNRQGGSRHPSPGFDRTHPSICVTECAAGGVSEFLSDGMTMIAKPFSLVALSEAVDAISGLVGYPE